MLRTIFTSCLICATLSHSAFADTVSYRQVQQDRLKQLTASATDFNQPSRKADDPASLTSSLQQVDEELPRFVRLPDGKIVPYGPGVVCTENCVESAFLERAVVGPRLWVWGIPVLAGGLLAGLMGGGVFGGGAEAGVVQPPVPTPTIPIVITTPTPPPPISAEVPEPSTFVLLGLGLGAMLRKRSRKDKQNKEIS